MPRKEWEELLGEMRRRADAAGLLRYALPEGAAAASDGSNLAMAIIREHLAAKGLGLHNDLQNESSIVGNFPTVMMCDAFGTEEQKASSSSGMITGKHARRLRAHRAQPRQRRHLARDDAPCATATSG